jgi:glycosyltransferase involved in cell wall biosynthesis
LGAARANVYISYFEGFGVPIIEAFACEVPVLTANTSSTPEVAGDAALLIDPFSIDDIALALERLALDANLCEELKRKGSERIQLFDWDKSAKDLWKVIETHLPKR